MKRIPWRSVSVATLLIGAFIAINLFMPTNQSRYQDGFQDGYEQGSWHTMQYYKFFGLFPSAYWRGEHFNENLQTYDDFRDTERFMEVNCEGIKPESDACSGSAEYECDVVSPWDNAWTIQEQIDKLGSSNTTALRIEGSSQGDTLTFMGNYTISYSEEPAVSPEVEAARDRLFDKLGYE